jgi:hypothetical protein
MSSVCCQATPPEMGSETGTLARIPLKRISEDRVLPQLARPMRVVHRPFPS